MKTPNCTCTQLLVLSTLLCLMPQYSSGRPLPSSQLSKLFKEKATKINPILYSSPWQPPTPLQVAKPYICVSFQKTCGVWRGASGGQCSRETVTSSAAIGGILPDGSPLKHSREGQLRKRGNSHRHPEPQHPRPQQQEWPLTRTDL